MKNPLALIVDDEPDIRELLEITLNRMSIDTVCAHNVASSLTMLTQHEFQLCLADMRLPDGDGLDLVDYIQKHQPSLPVAVVSAYGNMETVIKAMKKGAFDFIAKPIDLTTLRQVITSALSLSAKPPEHDLLGKPIAGEVLLGESPGMIAIREQIEKLSRSQAPVYINGESGVGKELVARLIHERGPRSQQPFIAVNCGAIPKELMESEFFGHRKGSFTGALADKPGLFQAANNGTLFLDEVADLPMTLQVKLLRAIQEKQIRPVGSQQEITVDVRLLSATHRNLAEMVNTGHFRQDLYYRINVIELFVPPLRERMDDIPQLAEHLLSKLAKVNHGLPPKLSNAAIAALKKYTFPGNVRELENILERALTLYNGLIIEESDLNFPPTVATPLDIIDWATEGNDADFSLETYLNNLEKQMICAALERHRWNLPATARQLGLSFRSLRYRLKKLGIAEAAQAKHAFDS